MANGFKFSLQKVLDIRVEKEEESKRLFQKTQREKILIEQKIREMNESFEQHKSIKSGESAAYQKIKRNYLNALSSGIQDKEKELENKDKELNYRREDLKKKQIDKKTVEILKEKRYEAFIKELDRQEQITNDEFALYAHLRNIERR
ncbi:flagellar export protein FliJ [Clostridium sp. YIM B02505]|uniref:Flagellar FliJ protein n=1 Tax=Clostridium yunnanense TaxID=2800325 RepID=A0ABS1EU70_9CLOT|nr:flagellar export protein FliJ [Clostridium yunnanense]MBK1812921.1 flagellar export protein FliJ [Clostridium yunnanense]